MKSFLARMLSEGDGSPSTKRVLFALVVLALLSFCAADISVNHGHLTSKTIDLAKTLLVATGSAYAVGRIVESKE